jgi:hypothetical protein
VTAPGEYRLLAEMQGWEKRSRRARDPSRRLALPGLDRRTSSAGPVGRKQLRMEYFYREMRRRYELLMDDERASPRAASGTTTRTTAAAGAARKRYRSAPPLSPTPSREEVLELVLAASFRTIPVTSTRVPPGRHGRAGARGAVRLVLRSRPGSLRHLPGCAGRGVAVDVPRAHFHVPEHRPAGAPRRLPARRGGLARRSAVPWRRPRVLSARCWAGVSTCAASTGTRCPEYAERDTFATQTARCRTGSGLLKTDMRCLSTGAGPEPGARLCAPYPAPHGDRQLCPARGSRCARRVCAGISPCTSMPSSGSSCPTPWAWPCTATAA